MRLSINHVTQFQYDEPVVRGMQRLRFTPKSTSSQLVERWDLGVEGGRTEAEYRDHYGNEVRLISMEGDIDGELTWTMGSWRGTARLSAARVSESEQPRDSLELVLLDVRGTRFGSPLVGTLADRKLVSDTVPVAGSVS